MMARSLVALFALGMAVAPAAGAATRTLRVDYYHFTRDDVPFCRVCQRAIARVIDLYTKQP